MRRHALALALALTSGSACLSLSTTALADDANREAAAHFTRGVTYYGEGDYPAALVEFDRAYAIAPT
ncbi:MAG: tetratricopeptide repeat protein, partial [Polyangiaceae bacterium]|nr:tetratricopeptide repeat protein [Polyangiaceae bacterium]